MKSLPALAFVAALAAFVVLPLSFAVGGSILFSAGLVAIVFSDYTRTCGGFLSTSNVRARLRGERFGLAA
ncbi:MAG: hypothetical protein Q7S40_25170 [Opitutaceae bacterium]|nr:hypothetical protein [Opitutaceae bacterium]